MQEVDGGLVLWFPSKQTQTWLGARLGRGREKHYMSSWRTEINMRALSSVKCFSVVGSLPPTPGGCWGKGGILVVLGCVVGVSIAAPQLSTYSRTQCILGWIWETLLMSNAISCIDTQVLLRFGGGCILCSFTSYIPPFLCSVSTKQNIRLAPGNGGRRRMKSKKEGEVVRVSVRLTLGGNRFGVACGDNNMQY